MQTERIYDLNTDNDPEPIHLILGELDFIHIQQLLEFITEMNGSLPEQKLKCVQRSLDDTIMKSVQVDSTVVDCIAAGHYFANLLLGLQKCAPMLNNIGMPLSQIHF